MNWTVDKEEFNVRIENAPGAGTIHVNDRPTLFQVLERTQNSALLLVDGKVHRVHMTPSAKGCTVWWNGRTYHLRRSVGAAVSEMSPTAGNGEVRSAMPGKILRIDVAEGAPVAEKHALLVMESMKMETTIHAPMTGRVAEILVKPGQVVGMSDLLMRIE